VYSSFVGVHVWVNAYKLVRLDIFSSITQNIIFTETGVSVPLGDIGSAQTIYL